MTASNRKPQTLQEKFGFHDDDLKTPQHDAIMMWLDGEARRDAQSLFGIPSTWTQPQIERTDRVYRDYCSKIGPDAKAKPALPEWMPPKVLACVWEQPVAKTGSNWVAGFVDLRATVAVSDFLHTYNGYWHKEGLQFTFCYSDVDFLVEVKPKISSAGETIRQIRFYEQHYAERPAQFYIASQDTRFKGLFERQGIGFIEVPKHVIG